MDARERDIEHFVENASVDGDGLHSTGQDSGHCALGEGASVAGLELGLIVFVGLEFGEEVQTFARLAHNTQMHFLGRVHRVKRTEKLRLRADAPLERVGQHAHVLGRRRIQKGVACVQILRD